MASILPESTAASAIPVVAEPAVIPPTPTLGAQLDDTSPPSSSSSSISSDDGVKRSNRLSRPPMGSRMSSGTIIIASTSAVVEMREGDEDYDENDARTMSPRRSSEEIERMGQDARQAMIEQAKQLQASLLEIVDRVESVRSEHEKLEGGNRFLQSYIGELMQTSKIAFAGAANKKGKGRSTK
ncbi:hypothetical protein W97_06475 [Coniosporium apollinis CBS 100218]|uniref:BZIP transcription factor n=1 Tax=Coniosporium apollinis (strain CBS 100218) TaxID=1168221 RepID=R7YZ89_CONA1|nr:uncharacterized protein W97_06475 [Coniosporium apollinis CBS 100218]EON67222.1 hypothetical protein W97_06475 [Coniosporium apollinis CBS 100218]